MKPVMNDLIERLEKATGPDRALDAAITVALDIRPEWLRDVKGEMWVEPVDRISGGPIIRFRDASIPRRSGGNPPTGTYENYTGSIDAALMLVPAGWVWSVCSCCLTDDAWTAPDYNSPEHGDRLRKELGEPIRGHWTDEGFDIALHPATGNPAIALCIAALKARAAIAKAEGLT